MDIKRLVVGSIGANCYVVGDERQVFVVDPGDEAGVILEAIGERELLYIFLTHNHYDHIGALNHLMESHPEAEVAIHADDADGLFDGSLNLSSHFGISFCFDYKPALYLEDGQEIAFGDDVIKVIHTPGHTPGGICLLLNEDLFSGDTLFLQSIGRTDLPGGDHTKLLASVREKLFSLPGDVKVHPGHMGATTIAREKASNPFL